ncbi:MAG: D-alanine-D-alanine ligase affects cell division [Pseudomonadota bacterium]|jgi:D-alanine-D-alanine ligase
MSNTNKNKLDKVAVLMGGKSAERDISIMSGTGVLEALKNKGVNAHSFDPKTQNLQELKEMGFTSAFIALHGRFGEDGTMQGILEHLAIPYTGSGVMASSIAMNKEITKRIWQSYGLSTPKFFMLNDDSNLEDVVKTLGLPLIVKPAREGSSIGLSKVYKFEDLAPAYAKAKELDSLVMAEQFIQGREITCAVIEQNGVPQALPLIEIKAPDGEYDYNNKYFTDDVKYICPAELNEELTKQIQDLVLNSFTTLGCRGWARADVMLDDANDGTPYLLEINTSPGMTSHSLVPMAAKAIGVSYEELVLKVLNQASSDY